jgi:ribulose-phosphate 3-epimerase
MSPVALAPSILSADFARLGEQVAEAEAAGADRVHVDVMDGHFVPNISIGPVVVHSLRRVTRLPLEAHLMIAEPDRFLEAFAEAGVDGVTVHVGGAVHLHRTLEAIAKLGKRVGVALNPATPATALDEVLSQVDLILVMTVDPGFGGQDFIASTLPKVRRIRELLDHARRDCELEVDGGIHPATARLAVEAGARVLVAGSAVFEDPRGVRAAMERLRASARA